ncbi:acyl-CoA dehydrogenase family protein [Croceicoccus gelatinilyticus]|uniref:acyl-CoA dehydrogenase family protein n=1 Tax=Croceicoccus gelatinilyticus TaxID=2835536 RepID=UPI001BD1A966|nr:acyl-CoA dehydrogenase C-terminal domain-containing protein [Croceicoccus gelatinilyticus]MBS7668968.1 acyl-CoA dehydrogenase C-terminal domain-containing protein [Croceicoccus gelatinilyticus]
MPIQYEPPVRSMRFILDHVVDFDAEVAALPGCEDVSAEFGEELLTMAGRFCAEQLLPLNQSGDRQGATLADGKVTTADGFADAYHAFVEGGWGALSGEPDYEGQGLPRAFQIMLDEMVSSANMSFGLFPGLTRGASEALAEHGSEELKAKYLPKLTTGEWCGAMALTEAHAGTDLGLLRTKAVPVGDGSYKVTGTKIFISSGDQDFGNNIIHLVLARLPDAAPGVKGISLFLVPKLMTDDDGNVTGENGVSAAALEHKMGIHAQPTCVMNYDDATGWLIGEPGRGLNAMFTMMNAERLYVGIQGLGVAEIAVQNAVAYAHERLQGRGPDGTGPAPIINHADVRRMILMGRSFVEPARALAAWTAIRMDVAARHPDEATRAAANADVALLTPVVKAAFTDMGFETAVNAQQVFGGHGYIWEAGMEQFVRDARITQIYEGTNGVQAMDLVTRKVTMADGAPLASYLDRIEADLGEGASELEASLLPAVRAALASLRKASAAVQADTSIDAMGSAAVNYLRLFAIASMGWMWVRMAAASLEHGDETTKTRNLALANFYAAHVLPQAGALEAAIAAGPDAVMALPADLF